MDGPRLLNVNVGILGHVDSGKTSLVAALSTVLSTAALDKHPQSRERGITLDLGFSSFTLPATPEAREAGYEGIQFTLVDCPGHASLIRTVVGGAQIMNAMLLVVDVTKGIQTQTAECIVIGEITTDRMIVVLNKIDQLDPEKRERHTKKAKKLVAETLAATKFAGCPILAVAARPGAGDGGAHTNAAGPMGIDELRAALLSCVSLEAPPLSSSFLFYIDHCFAVKGQGTVLTGTVSSGRVAVGDTIELPALKLQRKVKSMQMFRRPVNAAQRGDRVGICVTQLDASSIERGLACSPGTGPTFSGAIVSVEKVRFYPGTIPSNSKLHVIIGHSTVMARVQFFGTPRTAALDSAQQDLQAFNVASLIPPPFDFSRQYLFQEELYGPEGRPARAEGGTPAHDSIAKGQEFATSELPPHYGPQWALFHFEEPVTAPTNALVIGARLDADLNAAACRIAVSGRMRALLDPSVPEDLRRLRVYKLKAREGMIERVEADGCTAVCKGMFGKDSDLSRFVGMEVQGPEGQKGVLEGSFGKSGKFKVRFQQPIRIDKNGPAAVVLLYKRFLYDPDKRRIAQ